MTLQNSIYQPPLIWQLTQGNTITMDSFIGYSTGGNSSLTSFTLPATIKFGDMFAAATSLGTGGFTITRNNGNQKIYSNGVNGNIITMNNTGSSIFLLCTLDQGGTQSLTVMDFNGTFTLT